MKASTKRLLSLLLSAALVLFTFIIYITLIKPEYGSIQDLRGRLNSNIDFYNNQAQAVDYVNNLYGKNKVDIEQIKNDLSLSLPGDESVADIIYQIQAITTSNNMFIESIDLNKLPISQSKTQSSLVKSFGTLRINLRLTGPYPSFKNFCRLIESNIRIMDIRSIRIFQANELEKGIFNYEAVVDTYYQIK